MLILKSEAHYTVKKTGLTQSSSFSFSLIVIVQFYAEYSIMTIAYLSSVPEINPGANSDILLISISFVLVFRFDKLSFVNDTNFYFHLFILMMRKRKT